MKLKSSIFLSIVLLFLIASAKQAPIKKVKSNENLNFSYISKINNQNNNDKIKIDIFDNLKCKNCQNYILDTINKIKKLKNQDIEIYLYVISDLNNDLENKTALALKCASEQSKYWEIYQKIHEEDAINIKKLAKDLKLNIGKLDLCIDEKKYEKDIEKDINYALKLNIKFSPTIIINNNKLIGEQPFENIKILIEEESEKIKEKKEIMEKIKKDLTQNKNLLKDNNKKIDNQNKKQEINGSLNIDTSIRSYIK